MKILKRLFGAFLSGGMLVGSLYLLYTASYQETFSSFGELLVGLIITLAAFISLIIIIVTFIYGIRLMLGK